jgi:hypothetical protein
MVSTIFLKNCLDRLLKPVISKLMPSFMIQMRHELGSYTLLVKPNCHQASWEPLSRYYTYAGALILADTVLVRAQADDLHQKRVRAMN